jgi:methionyl-tRNA formyltransferase
VKLVFAGTPEFAVPALRTLHAAGHAILAVLTQPDRPAGRGQKLLASPVALAATELGLSVHKPASLREAGAQALLRELAPEALVVVAYGQILPQAVLDIPRHGCFNIHASLLPRWRGAAPIQRAILAGDRASGVTIMRMEVGLDTGPMLLAEAVPIGEDTTSASLHDALAPLGARLMVEVLRRLESGRLDQTAQPADGITYAPKLSKDEARIDWSLGAAVIARAVRAYDPYPVAWTELGGERVRIHAARVLDADVSSVPGTILLADDGGIRVATGAGLLAVQRLQWPGGRVLEAREAAAGRALAGKRFS